MLPLDFESLLSTSQKPLVSILRCAKQSDPSARNPLRKRNNTTYTLRLATTSFRHEAANHEREQVYQVPTCWISHGARTPHGVVEVTQQWHVYRNSTPCRCHVAVVFAGGCAWEPGYGHQSMSIVVLYVYTTHASLCIALPLDIHSKLL